MSDPVSDLAQRAAVTADRLRLLQADHADQTDETRRRHLSQAVQHALDAVPPLERQAFLRELLSRFPVWAAEPDGPTEPAEPDAADQTQADLSGLHDATFLADRLAGLADTLSEEEREAVGRRLAGAGLAPGGDQAWPEDATGVLRERLRLGSQGRIDPARALELVAELADFACTLDQLAWKTWSTMAPGSAMARPGGLRATMGRFFASEDDAVAKQVFGDLEKVRHLVAALLSGVTQAGRQFARRCLSRLSPAQISSLAELEPGGFLVGHEQKCWRKYVELAESMDPSAVERELMDIIVQYAETLLSKVGR